MISKSMKSRFHLLLLAKMDLSFLKTRSNRLLDAIADPAKVKAGKPASDIFLAAAFALNISPYDCVGIEDSVAGVKAINSAGSVSIGVGGDELNHADKRFTAQLT